jgi:hypothetical protein
MSVEDASKMIEAVLSYNPADQVRARDAGTVARSCEPHCAVSTTTGAVIGGANVPQGPPQNQGAQQYQGPPQNSAPTVSLGETVDQVTAAMGPPVQVINLGPKQIYRYQEMKIIFLNGKVSDVQ